MLPDYPKTKAIIQSNIRERMVAIQQSQLGIFSTARAHAIAEGRKVLLHRQDGSVGEIAPKPIEATASRTKAEFDVMTVTLAAEEHLLFELASKMAEVQSGLMFETIDEMVTEYGNQIPSKQSVEDQYLEGLGKILIDFCKDGQPYLPTYFAPSAQMQQRLAVAVENVMSNAVLRQRFDAIIELKRQEWNDREAARNMVE